MADGVVLNAGSGGVTAATDDAGAAGHVQIVKLALSADGSATPITADASGLEVQGAGTAGTAAGGVVTIQGVASMTAVQVADNGGSLTVDGTVGVSGTVTVDGSGVTQPVSAAGLTAINDAVKAEDAAHSTGDKGIPALTVRQDTAAALSGTDADYQPLISDANGRLHVIEPSAAAAAASLSVVDDWDESDRAKVNLIVGQAGIAAGNGASGATVPRVTIANDSTGVLATVTTVTTLTGGGVAHDAADSGNPHKIGGRADTTFQTAAADGDRVDALFDVYGLQYARIDHPNKWFHNTNGSSALTDTEIAAAPGAGLSNYLTDVIISSGAATAMNAFIEEGASKKLGNYYLEAVAGRSIHLRLATPYKATANTALTVTTSAAIAHTVTFSGFIAP